MIKYNGPMVISVEVKDIERSAKFYTEILGFERGWEGTLEVGWLELIGPVEGMYIGLSLKRNGEVKHGSTTINFGVKDVTETKAYLDSKGVKTMDITEIPEMVKMLMAFDPDGNMLAFVQSLVEVP